MNENIKIKNLPCYPDDLPDLEANDIGFDGDYGCEGCEHFVVSYAVTEGPNTIGYAMKCDKGLWEDMV